jgi:hypothetical protein
MGSMAFSRDESMNVMARERVMACFARFGRPLFLGAISVEIAHTLARTEIVVQELVDAKQIYELSSSEKRRLEVDDRSVMYWLVGVPITH